MDDKCAVYKLLSNKDILPQTHTCVLVKLTDKCNTTLQNAVANGLKSSSTPLIKVHVDADAASGKLVIAGVNEAPVDFRWHSQPASSSGQPLLETLILHNGRKVASVLPPVVHRMLVDATDSTFQETQDKTKRVMASVRDKQEKMELSNDTKANKKGVARLKMAGGGGAGKPPITSGKRSSMVGMPKVKPADRTNERAPPPNVPVAHQDQPTNGSHTVKLPKSTTKDVEQKSPEEPSVFSSDIKDYSLELRIIHQLPFITRDKATIFLRLSKDGLTDEENKQFDDVLEQVAERKDTTEQYTLRDECYARVDMNWRFWDAITRRTIAKNMQRRSAGVVEAPTLPPVGRSSNNYDEMYGAPISNVEEYHRLRRTYEMDYPVYMRAYNAVAEASALFERLGERFHSSGEKSNERAQVIREIQEQFERFTTSSEFAEARKTNEDLKAKLTIIKQRIQEFEACVPDKPTEKSTGS